MIAKDALEFFFNTVKRSAKAEILAIPGRDDQVYLVQGGNHSGVPIPPPRRAHHVERLEDLCELAKREQTDGVHAVPSIWHSHTEVALLLDHDDRRDRVTMPLDLTVAFARLQALHKERPWLSQDDLIRMLRVDLAATVPPELLKTVRTIRFRQATDADTSDQTTSKRLGLSIEKQVTGAGELPEDVTCRGHVYRDIEAEQFTIRLALEIDFEHQKFRLLPVGDCVDDAITAAQNDLRGLINGCLGDDSGVLVFQGTP